MSTRTRLGLFGASLVAVFVVGFLGGAAVGPLDGTDGSTEAPHVMEGTESTDE